MTDLELKHYDVIVRPIVTEKSTIIGDDGSKVVFEVTKEATKPQIKSAVEALFSVSVTTVNVLNIKGKRKSFRRIPGKRNDVRKAIVSLADGHRIDVSSGLGTKGN